MARITVLGDVHGNLPALEAVLRDAGECDGLWVVGDTVGYGPYPNECVRRVEELGAVTVAGNHDLGSIGSIDLDSFNPYARKACEWTDSVLDPRSRDYLESRPLTAHPGGGILLVHASPQDPVWEYVVSESDAAANLEVFEEKACFHGHSHVPAVFAAGAGGTRKVAPPFREDVVLLDEGQRYMLNVGSVGQPRDGDPRACYVKLDTGGGVVTFRWVEYTVSTVQERMEEVGLPEFLASRLALGL